MALDFSLRIARDTIQKWITHTIQGLFLFNKLKVLINDSPVSLPTQFPPHGTTGFKSESTASFYMGKLS